MIEPVYSNTPSISVQRYRYAACYNHKKVFVICIAAVARRRGLSHTWRHPPWPFTRYSKMLVAHAPGMPGAFSPPPTSKESASYRSRRASRHVRHARAVMHSGIAYPRCQGKRSRHSRRMRSRQFYVSGKRPIGQPALAFVSDQECAISGWIFGFDCMMFV